MKRFIVAGLLCIVLLAGCIRLETDEPNPVMVLSNPTQVESTPIVGPAEITAAIPPIETNTPPPQAFNWKNWPILPHVSDRAREIYQQGLALGNNPNHFTILGDCQSLPDIFMGRYESNADINSSLPVNLQETVTKFGESFTRLSPTIKPGTTAGAILWKDWIDRSVFTDCTADETPLDCELRVWKPSLVLINLGTHWETRDQQYLDSILDELIGKGILPTLATKADNREADDSVNLLIAETAERYDIPFWNFWSAVQALPNGGLKTESDVAEMYLTDAGLDAHRYTALQVIDSVWRQASAP